MLYIKLIINQKQRPFLSINYQSMKFKIAFFTLFILFVIPGFGQSGKGYQYRVDLTKVVDDRVYVELTTPKISTEETTFYLPKIVPGTYSIADYGRYVSSLKAFDKKGNELVTEKIDTNGWKIKNAKKLAKVTYWIDDIVDTKMEGPQVYPMAATNIEDGKCFVINSSGYFGYFENVKEVPIQFDITRPKDFYGSTGLIAMETGIQPPKVKKEIDPSVDNKRTDRYAVENYDRLIDSPLLYAKTDTAVIRVANAEVLIGSYSPNNKINAKEIANTVREVLQAQAKYLGGKLPVEKYAFIFYFTDQPIVTYGALEHSYSSLYYMPETTIDKMNQQLRDFAAHEFFHIVTPLNIHSKEIHQFGFNDPKMSKHLWMYEGVTEYFAGNVQVKYGLITNNDYLNVVRGKMLNADGYNQDLAFTDLSKYTLDKYADQYGNVYQKGALIGMCLDIKLRKLSGGKYGVQNLMADLSKKYGKYQPFEDETLFDDIEKITYPEIGHFLRTHVGGSERLPFKEIFDAVGISYLAEQPAQKFSLGYNPGAFDLAEIDGKKKLRIANVAALNEQGKTLGLKEGDVLVKINGEVMPDLGPELSTFITRQRESLKDGEKLSFSVLRKDEANNYQTVELQATVVKVNYMEQHIMHFDEHASAEALALRKAWLSAD